MSAELQRQPHLDGGQGDGEEQTETYTGYDKGAPEPATTPGAKSSSSATSSASRQADAVELSLEEAILFAKKYLEDMLSFFGLNTDVYATSSDDDEVIELHVPSTHLNGFLIGQRGETMRAMQFMVSNALKNNNYQTSRVSVDIAEYKKSRADRLSAKAKEWVESVKTSGQEMPLRPMSAADRRTVHKLASEYGLQTESVGEGRDRHIVLKPAKD